MTPEPPTAGIFISYRREESHPQAGRLFDNLAARFGEERVFMDVDSIGLGLDFVEVIEDAVSSCLALLVVIGPKWLDAVDEDGKRRLDDPEDFVRIEIRTALERDVPVVPILLNGARMPQASLLPQDLERLRRRQALHLDDASFRTDVRVLLDQLERVLSASTPVPAALPPTAAQSAPAPRAPASAELIVREPRRLVLHVQLAHESHEVEVYVGLVVAWVAVDGTKVYNAPGDGEFRNETPISFVLADGEDEVSAVGRFDLNWSGQKLASAALDVGDTTVYSD